VGPFGCVVMSSSYHLVKVDQRGWCPTCVHCFSVSYKNQDHLLPPDGYLFGIFRETATVVYRPAYVVRTWIMNIEETGSAL